ncbi:unnamed protein product [Amaranthus hypochondriacus]
MGLNPKTQFSLANTAPLKDLMLKTMLNFSNFILVSCWSMIFHVFDLLLRYILRNSEEKSIEKASILDEKLIENDDEMDFDQIEEVQIPKYNVENLFYTSNTNKYEFSTGNSVCAFIEEPQNMEIKVQEIFVISHDNDDEKSVDLPTCNSIEKNDTSFEVVLHDSCVDYDDKLDELSEEMIVKQSETECSVLGLCLEEQGEVFQDEMVEQVMEKDEISVEEQVEVFDEDEIVEQVIGKEEIEDQEQKDEMIDKKDDFCDKSKSDDFWEVIYKYDYFLEDCNEEIDCSSNEILSPLYAHSRYDQDHKMNIRQHVVSKSLDSIKTYISELKEFDDSKSKEDEEIKKSDLILMEQKELIRQMKKEIRQLKICGLPTILEESESPRVVEDLRPLKIDERIGYKDIMEEIHTLYRMYLDKMKKFDILSQQTMYAIGVVQLKYQNMGLNKKESIPVIKSIWLNKLRKQESEPVQKLIKDLQMELELGYVGHLCLSWEVLKWQHHKAEQLSDHDSDGFHQYNHVSGEFQKFQVLLQRFTEDEPFQHAPRVPHYVNTRSAHPALLQVPLIKDDPKSEWKKNGENGISLKMLKEVIGESICLYTEFVHADKEEVSTFSVMDICRVQVILQDPSDAELLAEIRSTLHKKEKKLRDLVRSGNCLVRKFQKHQDQKLISHEMLVAQVELGLVSRVLRMKKLSTDQLLWCHKKLNKIDIVNRKIYLDYSFLLFPC